MIGVHPTTVYRLCSGICFPKQSTVRKILHITGGAVGASDYLDVERPPAIIGARGRPRKSDANSQ